MISDEKIIEACKSSLTMSQACAKTGLHWNTFRKYAIKLNVFNPNKSGKGLKKTFKRTFGHDCYSLDDILEGKYPEYQSNKLRKRLLKEGKKEHKCEKCNLTEWQGNLIPLELNHKDGNRHNHLWINLEMICPNCHAQTETYRGKNVKK
jgi:hypothetical protein